jgi:hypothetical protein
MMIARFRAYGTPAALLFVDADGLKAPNDAFGHAARRGLIHLTETMITSVRQTDMWRGSAATTCHPARPCRRKSACRNGGAAADQVADCEFCFEGTCRS